MDQQMSYAILLSANVSFGSVMISVPATITLYLLSPVIRPESKAIAKGINLIMARKPARKPTAFSAHMFNFCPRLNAHKQNEIPLYARPWIMQ